MIIPFSDLKEVLTPVYNTFCTKYVSKIVEIFEREFSEENVDYHPSIDLDYFTHSFIQYYKIYLDTTTNNYYLVDLFDGNREFLDLEVPENNSLSLSEILNNINFEELLEDPFFSSHFLDPYILVKFPLTKVTNEKGEFTYIKNLFCKISITYQGHLVSMKFNRTHYTYEHFINNYMHSHILSIPKSDWTTFQRCCTGSGPINITMINLEREYNENQWAQFCWDLAKYVTIESLEGIPYRRLTVCDKLYSQELSLNDEHAIYSSRKEDTLINDFIEYLINNKILDFHWEHNQWTLAYSDTDYITILSNSFLRFYKEAIQTSVPYGTSPYDTSLSDLQQYYLTKVYIVNQKVYSSENEPTSYEEDFINNSRGAYICTFKGEPQYLEIDEPNLNSSVRAQYILNIGIIKFITYSLLTILNTQYNGSKIGTPTKTISFDNF